MSYFFKERSGVLPEIFTGITSIVNVINVQRTFLRWFWCLWFWCFYKNHFVQSTRSTPSPFLIVTFDRIGIGSRWSIVARIDIIARMIFSPAKFHRVVKARKIIRFISVFKKILSIDFSNERRKISFQLHVNFFSTLHFNRNDLFIIGI